MAAKPRHSGDSRQANRSIKFPAHAALCEAPFTTICSPRSNAASSRRRGSDSSPPRKRKKSPTPGNVRPTKPSLAAAQNKERRCLMTVVDSWSSAGPACITFDVPSYARLADHRSLEVIPDDPGCLRRETKKFRRALSAAALLTSIYELQASDGGDDGDFVLRFGLRVESISECAERQASRRKIPRNGME